MVQFAPNAAGLAAQPEEAADAAGLDARWAAAGEELRAELQPSAPDAFAALRPMAVRALAEAAAPEVRGYHAASRDYGRATMPESGLFYLGAARGQRDLVVLTRRLREAPCGEPTPLRSLAAEISELDGEMLAAYRPPASLDRHEEFVAAHAAIQGAADLDAAGAHHGALLRYLQAAIRFATLRGLPPAGTRAELRDRVREEMTRVQGDVRDHSIAAMLLQLAAVELDRAGEGAPTPITAALLADVLPRYRRALAPPTPAPAPAIAAECTVTLVRWPYT